MPYLLAGSYQPGRYEPKNEQLGIVRDPFGRPEWIRLGEPDWIRLGELNWIRLGGLNLDQIARTVTLKNQGGPSMHRVRHAPIARIVAPANDVLDRLLT